jgi:hypothetical protein
MSELEQMLKASIEIAAREKTIRRQADEIALLKAQLRVAKAKLERERFPRFDSHHLPALLRPQI